jgi:hypothetical protein
MSTKIRWGTTIVRLLAAVAILPGAHLGAQTCTNQAGQRFEVIYRDTNGHVNQAMQANNTFNSNNAFGVNQDYTAKSGGPPAASNSGLAGFPTAWFYEGTNQHIYFIQDFSAAGSVTTTDLTAQTGGPLAATGSSLTSVARSDGSWATYYVATNQHIYQLYFDSNTGVITNGDVTAGAGGPLAAIGSGLGAFDTGGPGTGVFYIGTDQHVHQMYWSGSAWSNGDVTAATSGFPAATNSALTVFGTQNPTLGLFYEGTNQNLYQFFWTGSAWTTGNVTFASGGPTVANGSALANTILGGPTQAAYHFDTNQNMFQLYWSGSAWSSGNLTFAVGGLPALSGSGLAGFSCGNPGIPIDLFYVGTDQNMYNIHWNSRAWSVKNFTSFTGGHLVAANSPLVAALN